MGEKLLEMKNIRIDFKMLKGVSHIINNLSLSIDKNSFLGLVGESGSGKSVLANSMLGYVKEPGIISAGEILYEGNNILKMPEEELIAKYRAKQVGLIASNARAHLNPLLTVGKQLSIVYSVHSGKTMMESKERALAMLNLVKINDPNRRFNSYPHELSGGMAQRIMIAMTLINNPHLIIADDCTNGLDVTVAAQILDLFLEVIETQKATSVIITHDLGIVAQCCTHVAIMYSGQIIETAPVAEFFSNCMHPYSRRLLNSLPENMGKEIEKNTVYSKINTYDLPSGCMYYDRCSNKTDKCKLADPEFTVAGNNHFVKCIHPQGGRGQ
jgi:oligopeptide/dipeptide ABC transporter ATP-binding protein